MLIAGLVLAGAAAALHVFIFWMESVAWEGPQAAKTFGLDPETARITKPLAFNQGFYNLFLAVAVAVGIVVVAAGGQAVGLTLVFTGAGSMLLAALVLLSDPGKRSAAVKQGTLPLLAVLALGIALAV